MNMIRYEDNFFKRLYLKIKNKFFINIKTDFSSKNQLKNDEVSPVQSVKKYQEELVKQEDIIRLADKLKNSQISLKELTSEEIKALIKYYKANNEALDREILYRKSVLRGIHKKLNAYYDRVVKPSESGGLA